MKRNWEVDELIEYWTLLPDEMTLLKNKSGSTRLGFAISLKFFQHEARFPSSQQEIPSAVVTHVASIVQVSPEDYQQYDLHGRIAKFHRAQIRGFFGFRQATVPDAREMVDWLISDVLCCESDPEHLLQIVKGRFRELRIEPPTSGRIERLIRSARNTYETNFFQKTYSQLSPSCCAAIDALLVTSSTTEPTAAPSDNPFQASLFSHLNSSPGRASLNSLLEEVSKLQHLRQISLPDDLFRDVSPKVLRTYSARAAIEYPSHLRFHPEPIRYTLVAAFCWLKTTDVTDNLVDLLIQMVHGIGTRAERKVDAVLMQDFKRVTGKYNILIEQDTKGNQRINRINYEICVLQTLRERLRCKEIWVVGANRYRNPEEDLPADFEQHREAYYQALKLPQNAAEFITSLKQAMEQALKTFNDGLPSNPKVEILNKGKGRIRLSPLEAQPEPTNIGRLKTELIQRWSMTSLLDILKEADLRIGFTDCFKSLASREALDRETIQKRLLLCLYGLGTNTGLKRVSHGTPDIHYHDLRYIKRRFIHSESLRAAIAEVVNAIFRARHSHIWGEGTTTCASDSKKFGATDQNLMTEWHVRYGGPGIMIYWVRFVG